MPHTYGTLDDLKNHLGLANDAVDDVVLRTALESAALLIDAATGRRFNQDPSEVARYYSAWSPDSLDVDDISTSAGLLVHTDDATGLFPTVWVLDTDFRLDPPNAALDTEPWTRLVAIGSKQFPLEYRRVKVTARFGWATTPTAIKQASLIQASRLFKRKDSPFGVAGSPEFGNELRLLSKLDPDVQKLVEQYRRGMAFA